MHNELLHGGSFFRHPLFVEPDQFRYKVMFRDKRQRTIAYKNIHEVILNIRSFDDNDGVFYVDKETNQEVSGMSIEHFRNTLVYALHSSTQEELEPLYMRLLLTNRHSKHIIDKGVFRQCDHHLKNRLSQMKGGYDCHLASEKRRNVLYLKYRRHSCVHLLSVIDKWNNDNDIHFNRINIPSMLSDQGLLYESLRAMLNKKSFKIYSYNPVEEDNVQPTDITSELRATIKQLIAVV